MERFHGNVGSTKAALQQRPEVLYALNVYLSIHVLLKVIYDLMRVLGFQIVVASEFVSHDRGASLNEIAHCSVHSRIPAISDDSGSDLSAALKCSDDHSLTATALHSLIATETLPFVL